MRRRVLYLEQRLAIAHKALNERSVEFENLLPEKDRERFNEFVLNVMRTLDGDRTAPMRLGLKVPR